MEHDLAPDMWPLKRGDTLSNHDWFPFHSHRFLSSRFVSMSCMKNRRGDLGTAVMLWSEAMRQDPAGTLPTCDFELANLARYATVEDWLEVKDGVLYGWVDVLVEDANLADPVKRLGHTGFMQSIVQDMHKRKAGRDAAREAGNLAVKKTRIRKKLLEMQVEPHIIADDRAIHELAEHFHHSGLYITYDNLRTAMVEVLGYGGQVRKFPGTERSSGD